MKKIINQLLPASCLYCHEILMQSGLICHDCQAELPWQQSTIPPMTLYGDLAISPVLFRYEPPIDHFISLLKFHHQLIYARLFSQCFITRLQNKGIILPECLLPVPLHDRRLRERGFNQALEIAKPIAKNLKIPLANDLCRRIKSTQPQINLSAKQRMNNIKNAFAIYKIPHVKHVAILDDVVTTGSTVYALIQLLKNHGVEKVEVWCVAKTNI